MKTKIKVNTKEGRDIIESFSNCLTNASHKQFFYIPMWFEKVGNGEYVMHEFGDLPKELKIMINNARSDSGSMHKNSGWEAIESPITPEDCFKINIKKK